MMFCAVLIILNPPLMGDQSLKSKPREEGFIIGMAPLFKAYVAWPVESKEKVMDISPSGEERLVAVSIGWVHPDKSNPKRQMSSCNLTFILNGFWL